jgi:hypothetical protein
MSATGEAPPGSEPATAAVPLEDANDLRGFHFRRLMRKPLTRVLVVGLALVAGAAGAALVGPAVGAAALTSALLIGVVVVFALADSAAADDFFEVYAQQRGMSLVPGRGRLPTATPLLRKGDERYTERTLIGPLGQGIGGTLALYTYEEESTDSEGRRQTSYYRYTLGLVDVPECVAHLPELYCQRKFGLRALEGFEDAFRGSKVRVELESEVLDEKYEIFATEQQDAVWLRRFFAPSFIVWLTDAAPKKFAFELVGGKLCCYVSGHKENAAELEAVAHATAAVAQRLREESGE